MAQAALAAQLAPTASVSTLVSCASLLAVYPAGQAVPEWVELDADQE
jgi:hypothetical protein